MKSQHFRKMEAGSGKQEAGKNSSSLQPLASRFEGGFSLIELMIAGVIVALTASLIVGGLVAANRSGELRTRQVIANQLLSSQLASLTDSLASPQPQEGGFPEPWTDSHWSLTVADTDTHGLKQLDLTVTHQGHSVHATTFRPVNEQ